MLEEPVSDTGLQGEPFQQKKYPDNTSTLTSLFLPQTGDQIVEVNGIDFSNLDHKEVRRGVFTCQP